MDIFHKFIFSLIFINIWMIFSIKFINITEWKKKMGKVFIRTKFINVTKSFYKNEKKEFSKNSYDTQSFQNIILYHLLIWLCFTQHWQYSSHISIINNDTQYYREAWQWCDPQLIHVTWKTRDPRALMVTWVSENLHRLLVRRPHICISTDPS